MSLERIKNSIIGKARKEAEAILEEAEANLRRKIESARATLKKDFEERLKNREAELEEEKNREIASLRGGYRMQLLTKKNQIIDLIFDQAIDRIVTSPDEAYLALLEKWIGKIDPDLSGQLLVNKSDLNRISQGVMERINRQRKEEGRMTLSPEPLDIKGGFIFKTEKFDVDYTLDTLIENLRGEFAPIIARELFDERSV